MNFKQKVSVQNSIRVIVFIRDFNQPSRKETINCRAVLSFCLDLNQKMDHVLLMNFNQKISNRNSIWVIMFLMDLYQKESLLKKKRLNAEEFRVLTR